MKRIIFLISFLCMVFLHSALHAQTPLDLLSNSLSPPPAAVPDRTPILIKIQQAKNKALEAYAEYEKALRIVTETSGSHAHKKTKRIKKYSSKEKLHVSPDIQDTIRQYLLETRIYILDQSDGSIHSLDFDERWGFPIKTNNCLIEQNGGNGHNMNLLVVCKKYGVMPVLALVHFHKKLKDIPHVYVPYSSFLHTAETIEAGKTYLRQTINRAFAELTKKNIPSRAFPGTYITNQFSKQFVEAVLIVEHIDHDDFHEALTLNTEGTETDISNKKTIRHLIEKVYVIDGINGPDSKKFSVSKAKACCRAQFIQSTHAMIVRDYPEAKLPHDFFAAMRNHIDAFQEAVLLFDHDMSELSNEARSVCMLSQEILQDCLAIAYNGGVHRLNGVIQTYKEDWDKQKTVRKGRRFLRKGLRPESAVYLAKIRAVREYLEADTPKDGTEK